LFFALQSFRQDTVTLFENGFVQFKLTIHKSKRCQHTRRSQLEQPANILRRDKVPGGAQQVSAKDAPFIECLINCSVSCGHHALRECPFGSGVILGLNGAGKQTVRAGSLILQLIQEDVL
jgi:hypothetical protein